MELVDYLLKCNKVSMDIDMDECIFESIYTRDTVMVKLPESPFVAVNLNTSNAPWLPLNVDEVNYGRKLTQKVSVERYKSGYLISEEYLRLTESVWYHMGYSAYFIEHSSGLWIHYSSFSSRLTLINEFEWR